MNLNFLVIMSGVLFILLIALVVYTIIKRNKEREDPDNAPLIDLYGNQYSDGHSHGALLEMDIGEKRIKLVVSPRDNNWFQIEKTKKFPKIETIYYDKRQVEDQADLSGHLKRIIAMTNKPENLPESFKKTEHGKAIMQMISNNNQLKDESDILNERMKNLKKISMKVEGGEIFTEGFEVIRQLLKDKSETKTEIKHEKK